VQKIQRKIGFIFGFAAIFLLSLTVVLWAYTPREIYNRPGPQMDYVPQEIGMGDYLYTSLEASDCRLCHGASVADRHHYSELALVSGLCTPCHETTEGPHPHLMIVTSCTTLGCHSAVDLGPLDVAGTPPNGWHHYTDFSYWDKCTACHDSDLTIDPRQLSPGPPPIVVMPSPFTCEDCHWEQPVIANTIGWENGDPQSTNPYAVSNMAGAGHPSTFDHNDPYTAYDIEGSTAGSWNDYYEYGKKIESNFDNHHVLFCGNVSTDCQRCHGVDPDDPSWNPGDPYLIRCCEICHDVATLHAIQPHVGDWVGLPGNPYNPDAVHSWEAVGFHVPDTSNTDTTDVAPTTYRLYTASEPCLGCHGYNDMFLPGPPAAVPKITDITPEVGTWDEGITLTGEDFGSAITTDRSVQITSTSGWNWSQVSVSSWTDTQIQFTIPDGTFGIGNYYLWVETEIGTSNVIAFTLTGVSIAPTHGKCREIITISSPSAPAQDIFNEISGDGIYRSVQIVGPSGTYIAATYGAWTAIDFKFRFGDVFEDTDNDFLHDPDEPLIRLCEGFSLGAYDIFIKDIHYQDTDGSNNYSEGDGILDVNTKGPMDFTLEAGLALYAVSPQNIERSHYCPDGTLINGVVKIYGWGFGSTQGTGKVYIGTGLMYTSDAGLALERLVWGDNLIKVGVDVPPGAKGKILYLWVEKDAQKTDDSYGWLGVQIFTSETCP
jgi:hypothetical protein